MNKVHSQYNIPQYSEFRDIVNKTQLPFWGFTKHIIFDIGSELFNIVNKKGLTDMFTISKFKCI